MATRLGVTLLLLVLLNACATPRVIRLDTGQGAPLEFRPSSSSNPSVKVDTEAFEEALAQLVLDVPLTLRAPQQVLLVRASHPGTRADSRWQRLMRKSFGGLCDPGQRRDHCLSLLDDGIGLGEWDKLGVALGLSLEPLKESIARAVEKTLAPQLFYTVIATGLITWAVLAANPEPVFTKAAAIVSAVLLIYLGVETFLEVVDASRELKRATDRATTWIELDQAGQRFANRVGPEVARGWPRGCRCCLATWRLRQPGHHGSAGPGKNWHHIVEQTPGNVARFGPHALHNTENVISLEGGLHTQVSAFYSRRNLRVTGSRDLTVRQWLRTQSYEAQRAFGLQAIANIRNGVW
ncbi:putative lipoprotein [Corallococcus coralloides]|uniref:Putative lipoprotein n=1 Tax=Corallococcus coralloides TaxID=184914 RepID=A0A410RVQ2_CORCK|nr:hypothetical protein [Corallococcus coralloides]QAT85932.1 putative lipoprotein [Corallococcus coralloides]